MLDFAKFYQAVHGFDPFPWQRALARKVAEEGWPEDYAIALPTASGKTSLLDIAVFALTSQAERPPGERTPPLRTFFVVDRRLVVDDVTRHAQKLTREINEPKSEELKEIKQRLLGFGSTTPLQIAMLRGGMYRSDTWADRPNQPLICVSTVDQIGSRLLFRGYGVGEKRRSVDAGLVGCDSLIIVDEAHLSEPFLNTVRSVRKYARRAQQQLSRSVRLVEMSATGTNESFRLSEEDYKHETLSRRLNATKTAELREVKNLEQEAEAEARRLAGKSRNKIIGIVLNTVNAARATFERLKDQDGGAVLLTGRIRPYDRDRLLEKFLTRMEVGRDRNKDERLFVVATQTVEVGADLDFDALITEDAPLDSLRQRFGRLDRLGELQTTEAVILKRKLGRGQVDPVYGEPALQTWEWLNQDAQTERSRKFIDFGALRMQELYEANGNRSLNAAKRAAPVLMPAHIETWIQTHPAPSPDPDVAPFLHGFESGAADVNLVWRADLDIAIRAWSEIVQLAPPVTTEALPVPMWIAKAWLNKQSVAPSADLEGIAETETDSEEPRQPTREFLIWRGPDESRIGRIEDIRPGDTLILKSNEGGADEFGWNPASTEPVRDIGDLCINERAELAGGRYVVRMHPFVYFPNDSESRNALQRDLNAWISDEDAQARICELAIARVPEPIGKHLKEHSDPAGKLYFATRWIKRLKPSKSGIPADETDQDDTASLTIAVPLSNHVGGVVKLATDFVAGCGLPDEVGSALIRAAELHDLGKCDERFQIMLDPTGQHLDELLAKGDGDHTKAEYDSRRRLAGYPRGARHEFWSVALAEKAADLKNSEFDDLVLYLIGAHHGHGRPFAPVWEELNETSVRATCNGAHLEANGADLQVLWSFGSGWVDRFWRLNRKYGYWGLAYLEAVLRRADCVRSRIEQET
jgi:CRISPR-associated endonuclease/helicase Cas3